MNLVTAGALGGLGAGMQDVGNKVLQAIMFNKQMDHDKMNRQLWGLLHSSEFNDRFHNGYNGQPGSQSGPGPSTPPSVSAAVVPTQSPTQHAVSPMQQRGMNRMTGPMQVDPAQDYVNARALGA